MKQLHKNINGQIYRNLSVSNINNIMFCEYSCQAEKKMLTMINVFDVLPEL